MEILFKKASEYVSALMKQGNYTFETAEKVSKVPASTIKKICSGETEYPRFDTLARLIISLGGDLNELIGYDKKKEIEINSTISLKETYDMRIESLKEYIASLKKDKKILAIAIAVLGGIVFLLLILDIVLASHGWIRY